MSINRQTRGERNFNPGNLDRTETVWRGMAANQTDPRFITFESPVMGIRALAKTLLTYYRKHGIDTVEGIIHRWAPSIENDTSAYVNHVAVELGVFPDTIINVESPSVLFALTKSIIKHENGRVAYDDSIIEDGIDQALA